MRGAGREAPPPLVGELWGARPLSSPKEFLAGWRPFPLLIERPRRGLEPYTCPSCVAGILSRAWERPQLAGPFSLLFEEGPGPVDRRQAKYFFIFFHQRHRQPRPGLRPGLASPDSVRAMTEPARTAQGDLVWSSHVELGTADNHRRSGRAPGKVATAASRTTSDRFSSSPTGCAAGHRDRRSPASSGRRRDAGTVDFWLNGQRLSPSSSPQSAFRPSLRGRRWWRGGFRRVSAGGKSAIDLVRGELSQLPPALGSRERQKLDLHVTRSASSKETAAAAAEA